MINRHDIEGLANEAISAKQRVKDAQLVAYQSEQDLIQGLMDAGMTEMFSVNYSRLKRLTRHTS